MIRPLLSILVAAFNVEDYIEGVLKSFDRQTANLNRVEFIVVDDGSNDKTADIAERWAKQKSNVAIVKQENSGVAGARQTALLRARGIWVTSVDPDDLIDRDYVKQILEFAESPLANGIHMMVTNVISMNDSNGRLNNNHPLKERFSSGNRIISLLKEPQAIQLGATAVMRLDDILSNDIQYDSNVRPTFEDAHFLGRYLAHYDEPLVVALSDAKYYYRRRNNSSSLVQSSWSNADKYSTVLKYGYVSLLKETKKIHGFAPLWAQFMVFYDICWYFVEDTKQYSRTAWLSEDLRTDFLAHLDTVFEYVDLETIHTFSIYPIPLSVRVSLALRLKGLQIAFPEILADDKSETFSVFVPGYLDLNITSVEPVNIIAHNFFNSFFSREYVFPNAKHAAVLHGISDIRDERYDYTIEQQEYPSEDSLDQVPSSTDIRSRSSVAQMDAKIRRLFDLISLRTLATGASYFSTVSAIIRSSLSRLVSRVRNRFYRIHRIRLIRKSSTPSVRHAYDHCWCIMDRPDKADDNAEHLYRFLLRNRQDINAFFVLKKTSEDWERLKSEGFRLLEPDSVQLSLAVLNADYIISSDAVNECMYPVHRALVNKGRSQFIFLQHGVIMNDLSRWLNPKDIRLMMTSTIDEFTAISGPNSPYQITPGGVKLTGLPRHDRLKNLKDTEAFSSDGVLLVMPTWRRSLQVSVSGCATESEQRAAFQSSRFYQVWSKVLADAQLESFARDKKLHVVFAVHPSLRPYLRFFDFPKYVELTTNNKTSFQTYLARSRLILTDYSSISFDAAYLRIPTVYYQYDKQEIYGGSHNFREGYFSYRLNGFGPVFSEHSSVLTAILSELNNPRILSIFESRFTRAFPHPDTNNCSRVVQAIESVNGE